MKLKLLIISLVLLSVAGKSFGLCNYMNMTSEEYSACLRQGDGKSAFGDLSDVGKSCITTYKRLYDGRIQAETVCK